MNKIIGFLITKEQKKDINIDFLNVGLKCIHLNHANYNIYLWGIGNIESCIINNKYSLSFPPHDNLLDRNVVISFDDDKIVVENDWLGAISVFYNQKEQIVSTLSNFCIKDKTIHNEGLVNFCEFGYSVFEQTFFEDVKFMRYYSKLIISNDSIRIEYKRDPILEQEFLSEPTTTDDVVSKMQEYISNIENKTNGEIIIPTSGGYDSRMLNFLVKDKSRIRSFTYGTSKDQSKSIEVVHAKKLSEIYNTKWEQIELKEYYKYLDKWIDIYGISTHTHGMYHIEFYTKILEKYKFDNPTLLSGIVGDMWRESGKFREVNSYEDMINLGYTSGMGMNLDLRYLLIKGDNKIKKEVFESIKEALKNDKLRSIYAVRTALILLSYLTQIPEYSGIPAWTPFLNFEIVKAILNLPDEQREKAIWLKKFYKSVGLNLEDMNLKSDRRNRLNYEIAKQTVFEPIDVDLMKSYISKERLIDINTILHKLNYLEAIKNELLFIPKIGGLLRRLGFKNEFLKALYEYYVIKAIERGLKYEP